MNREKQYFVDVEQMLRGYSSPINVTEQIVSSALQKREQAIYEAVINTGISVDIDKEELIKALQYDRNQYERGYFAGFNNGLNVDKWISVEEGLPDQGVHVLATDGDFVGEFFINNRGKWERPNVNDYRKYEVFGIGWWMPLPEPPKGAEQ